MRYISGFFRFLWSLSRNTWASIDENLRPGSGASALQWFFFFIFFLIGLVLVLLGVDLDTVDTWLEGHATTLDLIGSIAFRILCGLILLACIGLVAGGLTQQAMALFGKEKPKPERVAKLKAEEKAGDDRIGCMAIGIAAVIGYFAWIGTFGSY